MKTPVLIAGGGPVGLVLANALDYFGIECILVERNATTTRYPKMDLTNARSVELLTKLGLDDALNAVAVDRDHCLDVAWVTTMSGHELCRFEYPSVSEMRRRIRKINDGSMPSEAPVRVSQILLEPALRDALGSKPGVNVRFGVALESFEQTDDGVICHVRNTATGDLETIAASYLVGCDGGGSLVRKSLGIALQGEPAMRTSYMIHFKSKAHEVLQRWGIAWHYQSNRCTLVAQDDEENWTLHTRVPAGVDAASLDPDELLRNFLGCEIDHEIMLAEPWQAHLVVAEKYRDGRVFLAGDSAHQFVPTGGYGMNTGVGDAVDLAWKLAATLQGWGGPGLLQSYEIERQATAFRNRDAAKANVGIRFQIDELYASAGPLEGSSVEAEANRVALGAKLRAIGNPENERWGIEYGYIYRGSPVVRYDDLEPGADSDLEYLPTTQPGARMPNAFTKDGSSLHRLAGPWFTLYAFTDVSTHELERAAAELRVPLKVVRVADETVRAVYPQPLLLVRPDHHVAWRGDALPDDCGSLLKLCQRRSKSRPFGGVKPGHRVTCRGEWREGVARGPLPPALV